MLCSFSLSTKIASKLFIVSTNWREREREREREKKKKRLNRLVCPENNVRETEWPLITCPLFRKFLMRI